MILRWIALQGWRCFAEAVRVGEFGDRLNVVHGPNGVGKSTLMWALARGIFDSHSVSGSAVRALQPWGRDLQPAVTLEFDQGEQRFRLTKRLLSGCSSKLERLETGKYVPLAEGNAADQRVREMLAGEAPGRGVSDQRHWGLAQVLWAPQRGLAIELSAETSGAIQASLGAQVSRAGGEALEKRIAEAYSQVFTRTGALRRGQHAPAVVGLEEELSKQQANREQLLRKLDEFERCQRRIEDLAGRRDQALRDQQQLESDLRSARQRAEAYREALRQRDTQQEAVAAAEARHRQLQERIERIQQARRDGDDLQRQLTAMKEDLPLKLKEVERCRRNAETARGELERERVRRNEVQAARNTARRAKTFVEHRRQLVETDALLEKINTAHQHLETLRRRHSELVAPDAETLRAIRQAIKTRDEARVKLESALITVSIVADRDLELDVLTAEQTGRREVKLGQPARIVGSPVVEFVLPDVATFRATGPAGSVEQLRDQIAEAERQLEDLTEGFGTRNVDQLQRLRDQAAALDERIANAEGAVDGLLGDREPEGLGQQRARASQVIGEVLTQHPQWADSPPDAEMLAADADRIEADFVCAVEAAEARWHKSEETLSLATQDQAGHSGRLEELGGRVARACQRLDELTADGKDDALRRRELEQEALQWSAARGLLEEAQGRLAEFAGDPRDELEVLEKQLEHLQEEAIAAAAQLHHEEGQLQQLSAEAPYSALSLVEEDIDRLEKSVRAERLEIEAVRLLYQTLEGCRRSAVEAVAGPVEQMASLTLSRIAGSGLGGIRFDEQLLPAGVTPRQAAEQIGIDELSGGEQEQVHFAVRLALAHVLFEDQRQLVVLDDVFTYTDTARLARILKILEEAAEKFQILVFTCHPERYRGLPAAEFFDLEEKRG